MTFTWERVTFREEGAKRSTTLILRDPVEISFLGVPAITGIEVNKDDDEVAPTGVDERRRVIPTECISKRAELEMDLNYSWLVPLGTATLGVKR